MKNNEHSASHSGSGTSTGYTSTLSLKLDLLNISAVIGKIYFEQRGMLHQGYHLFGPEQY